MTTLNLLIKNMEIALHLLTSSLISFIGNLQFSTNRSCIYFVRFIQKYFILEGAEIDVKQWKQCQTLFFGAPKSLQMLTAAMKLKDAYSLEGKL